MSDFEKIRNLFEDPSYIKKVIDYSSERKEKRAKSIKKFIPQNAKKVLELGCGVGLLSSIHNGWVGLDISLNALKKIKEKKTVCANSERLPFKPESFDFVFSVLHLEHTRKPEEVINECDRVLKKNGVILFNDEWHCRVYPAKEKSPFSFLLFHLKLALKRFADETKLLFRIRVGLRFTPLILSKSNKYDFSALYHHNLASHLKSRGYCCINENKSFFRRVMEADPYFYERIDAQTVVLKKIKKNEKTAASSFNAII